MATQLLLGLDLRLQTLSNPQILLIQGQRKIRSQRQLNTPIRRIPRSTAHPSHNLRQNIFSRLCVLLYCFRIMQLRNFLVINIPLLISKKIGHQVFSSNTTICNCGQSQASNFKFRFRYRLHIFEGWLVYRVEVVKVAVQCGVREVVVTDTIIKEVIVIGLL